MENLSDKNCEATLISAMVSSKEALIVTIKELTPDHFYHQITRILFKTLSKLEKSNIPVDIITIINKLREDNIDISLPEVNEILDLDFSGGNYREYIKILHKHYCKRLRNKMVIDIRQAISLNEPESKIEKIIEDYEDKIRFESQSQSFSLCDIIEKNVKELEEINKSGGKVDIGLNVGFDSLNSVFRLKRGEIYVIAGKTAMGKTSLAIKISHIIATMNSKRVLYFTLETTKQQILDKILCQQYGISDDDLDYMDCTERANICNKLYEVFEGTGDNLVINDNSFLLRDIILESKLENKKRKIELIVVDHIGLVKGKVTGDNLAEVMQNKCMEFKILAKQLNIPIILISHLKRAHQQRDESKPPVNTDLYGGALENVACVIAFVYRPEYYELKEFDGKTKDELENVGYIIIRKNRYGRTGMVEMVFQKKSANFKECEK